MTETRKRALVLDDELLNRKALVRELKRTFEVVPSATYIEAIELLNQQHFDVIVSDRSLGPGPTGLEFLAEAHAVQPHAVRVMASGTAFDKDTAVAAVSGDIERFVAKPFRRGELLEAVRELLEARNLPTATPNPNETK